MRVGEMRSRWRTSTKLESPTGTSRSRGWTLKATGQGLAALADASVSASQPSSAGRFSADGSICAGSRSRCRPSKRSEEHTSELQSHHDLVCRLLLEKKK